MTIRHDPESIRATLQERRVAKDELGKAHRRIRELEREIVDLWMELRKDLERRAGQ